MVRGLNKLTARVLQILDQSNGQITRQGLRHRLAHVRAAALEHTLAHLKQCGEVEVLGEQVVLKSSAAAAPAPEVVPELPVPLAMMRAKADGAAAVNAIAERILRKLSDGTFSFSLETIRAFCWGYQDEPFAKATEMLLQKGVVAVEGGRMRLRGSAADQLVA